MLLSTFGLAMNFLRGFFSSIQTYTVSLPRLRLAQRSALAISYIYICSTGRNLGVCLTSSHRADGSDWFNIL